MVRFAEEYPDKISDEMKIKIGEEYKLYQEGIARLNIDKKKMKNIYDNKARDLAIWVPTDIMSGYMSYYFEMDKFNMEKYGNIISSNDLQFKLGILNLIPYVLESSLY